MRVRSEEACPVRLRRAARVIRTAVAGLCLLAVPARAARIGLVPLMGDGAAGRTIVLSGNCFEPSTTYTIRIGGFAVLPATVTSSAGGVIANTTLTLPDLPRGNLDVMLASATMTRSFTGAFRVWPNLCVSPVIGGGRFGETWETNVAIPTGGWVGMVFRVEGWGFAGGATIGANTITVGGAATTHPAIPVSAGGRFQSATIIVSSNLPNGNQSIVINDGAGNTFTGAYQVRRSIAMSPAKGYGALGSTILIEGWGFTPGTTGAITVGLATTTPGPGLAVAADGSFAGTVRLQGDPGGGQVAVTTGQGSFPNCYNDTTAGTRQLGIYPVTPDGPENGAIRIEGMGNWSNGTIAADSVTVQVPGGDVPTTHPAIPVANGRFPRRWIVVTDTIELNARGLSMANGGKQTNQAFYSRRNLGACPVYSDGTAGFTTTITGWSFDQGSAIAANSTTVGGVTTTHAGTKVDIYGELPPLAVALPALPNGNLAVVVTDSAVTSFASIMHARRTIGLSYVVGPGSAGDVTNLTGNGFVAGAIGANTITFGGTAVAHAGIVVTANGNFASTALTLPALAGGPKDVVAQGGEVFPQAFRVATVGLTVVKTQTPVAPGIGELVTYRVVVTNTGTGMLTNLTLTDTLSPVVVSASASEPSGWPTPAVTQAAAGTLFSWSNGAPGLAPGMALTFTITGRMGLVCANTQVSNTAFATGSDGCGGVAVAVRSAVGSIVAPPTMSLTVVKAHVPAAPVNGGNVTFSIIVTNAGTATLTGLTIVDTLSGSITCVSQTSDPALAWNGNASTVGWAGAVVVGPNASATVTVTATNTAPNAGWISNTVWVQATTACGTVQASALDPGYLLAAPVLTVAKSSSQPKGARGAVITYSITLSNMRVAGGACGDPWMTAKGIVFQDTVPAGMTFNAGTLQISTNNGATFNPAANLGVLPLIAVAVPDMNEGDGDPVCLPGNAVVVKFDVTVQ
ncbi:MAG: hypothetical protein AAB152_02925 [Candidatus Coatesbacteria bacterium]